MYGNWNSMMGNWGQPGWKMGALLLVAWSLLWKALALWRAAKEDSKPWFGAFLVINTVGILEIVYLFFFAKEKMTLATLSGTSKKTKSKSKK